MHAAKLLIRASTLKPKQAKDSKLVVQKYNSERSESFKG